MTIESAIIAFVILCACFIAANILVFPYRARQEKRLERMKKRHEKAFAGLEGQEKQERSYCRLLRRQLRREMGLIAYAESIQELLSQKDEAFRRWYIDLMQPLFGSLCQVYQKRNPINMTYFIYVLSLLLGHHQTVYPTIWEFLYVRLRSDSLICRQYALSAFYASGDVERTVKAIRYMNQYYDTYNDKLITDGLVTFSGDKDSLCSCLWELYPTLNVSFRRAVLNFLRLQSGAHREEVLGILQDPREDREVHFAAIRYLGKYPLEAAKPLLLRLVSTATRDTWIYGSVSARALAAYPGEDTIQALKKALFSPEWYIRLNASESLEKLGVDYMKLSDVINSSDRYAREIVQYRLEKRAREREVAV